MAARTAVYEKTRRSGRRPKSPIDRYGSSSAQTFSRSGGFDYDEIEAQDAHYREHYQVAQPRYHNPRRRSTEDGLRPPRENSQTTSRQIDRSATISRPGLSSSRSRDRTPQFNDRVDHSPEPMATSRAPQAQQVRFEEPYRRPSPPTGEAWTIASDQSDRTTPGLSSDRTRDDFRDYFAPPPATVRRAPSFTYEEDPTSPFSARSARRTPSPAVDGLENRPASDQIEHSARCVAHSSHYLRYASKHLQGNTGMSAKAHKVTEARDRLLDQAFRLDLWKTEVDLDHLLPFAESGTRPLAVMGRTLRRLKELTRTLELQCERYDTTIPPPSAAYRDKDAYDSGTGESDGGSGSTAGLRDPDNPDQVYSLEQSLHSVDAKLSTLRRLTRSVRSAGPDPGAQGLDMHILEMFDMFGTAEAVAESGVEPGMPGDAALIAARLRHGVRERIKY
nr:hypothetical protein B0A51_07258 [Rachicladosporium sp. CCFEE 5018]